jgi:hypothetical protein
VNFTYIVDASTSTGSVVLRRSQGFNLKPVYTRKDVEGLDLADEVCGARHARCFR